MSALLTGRHCKGPAIFLKTCSFCVCYLTLGHKQGRLQHINLFSQSLEVRNQGVCLEGHTPSKGSGEESFPACSSLCWLMAVLVMLPLVDAPPQFLPCLPVAFSPCVCVSAAKFFCSYLIRIPVILDLNNMTLS